MNNDEAPTISVYPVGLFRDIRDIWVDRHGTVAGSRARMRHRLHWIARSWRKRSYWNGYLAEVNYPGRLKHTTCGKGWTRKSAARDLGFRLWKENQA